MLTETAISAGHGEKKSRRRTIAIGCLLCHPTIKAAAKAAGIAEITLHRWLRDPQFSRDYARVRERVLEMASEQLRTGTLQAVAVLREIMANQKSPAASRVQAARSFLEATSLMKGGGVNLTLNNTLPNDLEGWEAAFLESFRGALASDRGLREKVRAILVDLEESNGEEAKPILQ